MEHWYALERKRVRKKMLRWLSALTVLGALMLFVISGSDNDRVVLNHTPLDKPFVGVSGGKGTGLVAVIKISGGIDGSYHGDNSPENTVRVLRESFVQAEGKKNLAGVLLLIDSYGGGAAASALLYRLCKKFRKSNPDIPVVAYVSESAYSGGYYAAVCAERIVVDPQAVVGSIGVIQRFFNTSKLGDAIGVTEHEIATGPRKGVGGQWREFTLEDKRMLQRTSNAMFHQFLEAVNDTRKIPLDTLLRESKEPLGRTSGASFSAQDALSGELVDEIVAVEDFFEHEAPKFAAKKKFADIEYVSLEKDVNGIAESMKKSSQALATGLFRALKQEAQQSTQSIRAE
jgi:signal peptide peptidase SppA